MIAMDFGATNKLCLHGKRGPLSTPESVCPKEFRGRTPAEKFALTLVYILEADDAVTESATVGSSGAEPALIADVVTDAPHRLFTLSSRTVKNFVKDRGATLGRRRRRGSHLVSGRRD